VRPAKSVSQKEFECESNESRIEDVSIPLSVGEPEFADTVDELFSCSDAGSQLEPDDDQPDYAACQLPGRDEVVDASARWQRLDSDIFLRRPAKETEAISEQQSLSQRQLHKEKAALEHEIERCRAELNKMTQEVTNSVKENKDPRVRIYKEMSKEGSNKVQHRDCHSPVRSMIDKSADQLRSDRRMPKVSHRLSDLKHIRSKNEHQEVVSHPRRSEVSEADRSPYPSFSRGDGSGKYQNGHHLNSRERRVFDPTAVTRFDLDSRKAVDRDMREDAYSDSSENGGDVLARHRRPLQRKSHGRYHRRSRQRSYSPFSEESRGSSQSRRGARRDMKPDKFSGTTSLETF